MNQKEFQEQALNSLNGLSNGQAAISLRLNSIESYIQKIENRLRKIELSAPTKKSAFFINKRNTPTA
jgi:hypothetical protein